MKERRIRDRFSHDILHKTIPLRLLSSERYKKVLLDNSQANAKITYRLLVRTAFEWNIYVHAFVLVRSFLGKESSILIEVRWNPHVQAKVFSLCVRQ